MREEGIEVESDAVETRVSLCLFLPIHQTRMFTFTAALILTKNAPRTAALLPALDEGLCRRCLIFFQINQSKKSFVYCRTCVCKIN